MSLLQNLKNKIERVKFQAVQKAQLDKVGLEAKDIIYKRTKSGKGLDSAKNTKMKFKPLSKAYVTRRKKMKLGEYGSPSRSNLTLTGQMLNSMKYTSKQKRVEIFIAKSSRSGSKHTNAEVAAFCEKNGRYFMGLAEGEIRIILNNYRKRLKLIARNILK